MPPRVLQRVDRVLLAETTLRRAMEDSLATGLAVIDPQGVILEIREMEPNNTNSIVANSDNVLFVLETARGWFERHGVRTGMVIQTESGPLLETLCSRLPR